MEEQGGMAMTELITSDLLVLPSPCPCALAPPSLKSEVNKPPKHAVTKNTDVCTCMAFLFFFTFSITLSKAGTTKTPCLACDWPHHPSNSQSWRPALSRPPKPSRLCTTSCPTEPPSIPHPPALLTRSLKSTRSCVSSPSVIKMEDHRYSIRQGNERILKIEHKGR